MNKSLSAYNYPKMPQKFGLLMKTFCGFQTSLKVYIYVGYLSIYHLSIYGFYMYKHIYIYTNILYIYMSKYFMHTYMGNFYGSPEERNVIL